ncbi:MAG: transglutaminaseTgpA domain-containing protein [Hylemonella sp.]|nr:transglutaminaseTgpA domain-containing protein [Hylemonella sp.]
MSAHAPLTLPVEPPLTSRMVLFFTACSYLCVALSFSYLDRRHGFFVGEGVFWLVWSLLGFGTALFYLGRGSRAAETHWKIMGGLATVIMLVVFFKYNLLRWAGVSLLLVLSARAVVLHTRRDFYLALTVIFVVSLMVATYWTADWTVWFYLAPAWLFASLALAWEHAAGAAVPRWAKGSMTLGFIALSFVLALLLFLFAPRPPTLGFGFLPPGTDTPNLNRQDAGGQGAQRGEGGGPGAGSDGSAAGSGQSAGAGSAWQRMFERMRRDLQDPNMPEWQRETLQRLTGWGEIAAAALSGNLVLGTKRVPGDELPGTSLGELLQQAGEYCVQQIIVPFWPWLLLLLVLALLVYRYWRRRYRIAAAGLLLLALWTVRTQPGWSMRLSARALDCCLRQQGHGPRRGVSLREQLAGAASVPDLPRRWLTYALDLYGETRFGAAAADARRAANMRKAVHGASQILSGLMPELRRT